MTCEEFIKANAPTADRQTRALMRRAWDAAFVEAIKAKSDSKTKADLKPEKKAPPKRVTREDGDA